MKQVLIIEASPRGSESASRTLTANLRARIASEHPEAVFVEHDLAKVAPPYLDHPTLKAFLTRDPEEARALQNLTTLSDKLVGELLASELLIVATPMWNFGIPASLKSWIDHIVRAGQTFNYAGAGVEGLVKNTKAILVLASGGVFSDGPWKSWDNVEPYLRLILGFVGIEDIQTVRAEGMTIPNLLEHAVANGTKAVEALAI